MIISEVLYRLFAIAVVVTALCMAPFIAAHEAHFQDAPASAAAMTNPYQGQPSAAAAGRKLYGVNCAQCHGANRQGIGPAPALDSETVKTAKPGELFWFITNGKVTSGMPAWSNLPKNQRWQIVTFLQGKTVK
jgi:mono/diheme cytochrome c family protein